MGDERRRSAVAIARLALEAPDLLPEHRNWLLSVAAWKYTEADGKWNTPYRSRAAIGITDLARLNHEHVFTRKWLRDQMLESPAKYKAILGLAVGCIVTRDEHKRLTMAERGRPELVGWGRYELADIEVVDLRVSDDRTGTRSRLDAFEPRRRQRSDPATEATEPNDYYAAKHARARRAVGLDPTATSTRIPYPKGTRVRGIAGGLFGHVGIVQRPTWPRLPEGQMVVGFESRISGPYKTIAVLPEEVEREP